MNQAKLLLLPLLAAGQMTVTAAPSAAQAQDYVVRCESQNNRYVECPVSGRADVSLRRQTSITPCVEGQSWGHDRRRNTIWVDGGCRAEFIVDGGRRPNDDRWSDNRFFRCESRNNRREFCAIPWRAGDVRLERQLSLTPCMEGQTWGYAGRRQIWVDGGCRAEFARGWGPGGRPGPGGGGPK